MMRQLLLAAVLCAYACGPSGRDEETGGPDAGTQPDSAGGGGGGGDGEQVYVYANTASELYRVDPDTLSVTKVGDFDFPGFGGDSMTDIAIDKNGGMIGVSFSSVYRVDSMTAKVTRLSSNLGGTFNGLSFVPASQIGQTGDDVLVGTRNSDGKVFRIDPMTGATTVIGDMGGVASSGDLVAVEGFGTVQTVVGNSTDVLARLAPQTFAASMIGGGTGFGEIWGLAYWKSKVYGFTNSGQFVLIDPTSGQATLVSQQSGMAWWGAAVTTLAPVIL